MSCRFALAIVSDIHYASAAEQAAGDDYEYRDIPNSLLRWTVQLYRHHIWMRYPLRQNGQLDRFLGDVGPVDYVIVNGDHACDTAASGVSDAAVRQSAQECLGKLRRQFGDKLIAGFGDHDLGKLPLFGAHGGMRLASWRCAVDELGLRPFWKLELGNYILIGVVSSLLALPVFAPDVLPEEQSEWEKLGEQHCAEIRAAFAALRPHQRVLLFCHDPTALPFLWRDNVVRSKLSHIEQTIIGHLHSNLFLWKSKLLAGMPVIRFLGHSIRRMSRGLNEARRWRHFRVRLCPSLAGIELLKDGGYLTVELDGEAEQPARFRFHRLRR
jgi:hypothetical protein